MSVVTKVAAALALSGALASAANGQVCEGQWLPGYGVRGVDGSVAAMTLWDPDGAGPEPQLLVIGGTFSMVGTTSARNIATWNGQEWKALGSGTSSPVRALTVFDGKLWVGGAFASAGGVETGPLASWDGNTWNGTGAEPVRIDALQEYQGALVASGIIKVAGASTSIAKWNGSAWSTLGPGSTIGSGVSVLTLYEGKLIAAGFFTSAGGKQAGGIAAWDGTWTPLGSGIEFPGGTIKSVCVYNGDLYAGGTFTKIGGVEATFLGRWTGKQWESTDLPVTLPSFTLGVNALSVFDGKLIVAGDTFPERVYSWDGAAWSPLGQRLQASVLCLQGYEGSLFAGTSSVYRSTEVGRGLTEFRGGAWKSIGIGFDDGLATIGSYGDQLILGGQMSQIAGVATGPIAKWKGATWSGLGMDAPTRVLEVRESNGLLYAAGTPALSAWNGSEWTQIPGLASSNSISVLSQFKSDLLAVGDIRLTDPDSVWPVAAWTGSQWKTFGTDLQGRADSAVEFEGDLVVIGSSLSLRLSSNPNALGPFRFDGTAWHAWPVGLSTGGTLFVYNGKLLVASSNVRTAGGVSYGAIAQWEGDRWASVGAGMYPTGSSTPTISVLTEYKGDLIAAGAFTRAGGVAVNNIARWNGIEWKAMGGGLTGGAVGDVRQHGDELIAIGGFRTAGGSLSAFFARWTDDPKPWLAVQPQAKPVNQGLTLKLSSAAASGYVNVSYQWKRHGEAVQDGPAGASVGGGIVTGAAGALLSPSDGSDVVLRIEGVQASDAGEYTVEFSNACNTTTSWAAAVSVNTCPGDLNTDGFVGDDDFNLFAAAYDTMLCDDPAMPIGCLSDWNGDGLVDDRDFQLFVVAYAGMVCG